MESKYFYYYAILDRAIVRMEKSNRAPGMMILWRGTEQLIEWLRASAEVCKNRLEASVSPEDILEELYYPVSFAEAYLGIEEMIESD